MYLPLEIPKAKVLITVKTYPNPSIQYGELVCNDGFLENKKWIRIYPIPFRSMPYDMQYSKYHWIEIDLIRKKSDHRQESYMPKLGVDAIITTLDKIDTGKQRDWLDRKEYALNEVFESMDELISLSKIPDVWKSLATVKPKEIVGFDIQEDDRDWKPKFKEEMKQFNLFDVRKERGTEEFQVVRKLPYKYYYRFLTEGDSNLRRMMIEDWEIGALYWKCLAQTKGDEVAANELVRKKYETEFLQRDLYFFVGTTLAHHRWAKNPFVIIGVFYPPVKPVEQQLKLF